VKINRVRVTRRSCLQGSALIALHAWGATRVRALAPVLRDMALDAFVIEGVLPDAASLARSTEPHVRVEILGDDPAKLFYGQLVPAWRRHGLRGLAGLTRAPALFLLEQLTADYGLRTVALQRIPAAVSDAFDDLRRSGPHGRHVVNPEMVRHALVEGDKAAFAWWMAPVRPPVRDDVMVIAT
jgi:hypothetical protein